MDCTYEKGFHLIFKLVRNVFPGVSQRLKSISGEKLDNADRLLQEQAASSIRLKKFHCQGGGVYSLYPHCDRDKVLDFIVCFQTISDYLDNLCDRTGVKDEEIFRQLHLSLLDAVDPFRNKADYYRYFPAKDDGGYLEALVEGSREALRALPHYEFVAPGIKKYVQLYSDLQSYKHMQDEVRGKYLETWAGYYTSKYPDIKWWEFSASSGSTLGIFILFTAAFDPDFTPKDVKALEKAYFPWICGLHILLDYYIDAGEDLAAGDLNFTTYYNDLKQCEQRITFFYKRAIEECSSLKYPKFHMTVVMGLIAMYLSDPKAIKGLNRLASRNILKSGSPRVKIYCMLCRMLRTAGAL